MRFDIRINNDLEGWEIIEIDAIMSDKGLEDAIVATFYDKIHAVAYLNFLNG